MLAPGAVGTPYGFPIVAAGATGMSTCPWFGAQEMRRTAGASETSESTGSTAAAATAKALGKATPDPPEGEASPGPSAAATAAELRPEPPTKRPDRSIATPPAQASVTLQEVPQHAPAPAPAPAPALAQSPAYLPALNSLGFSSLALYSAEAKAAEERSRSAPRKGPRPIQMPRL